MNITRVEDLAQHMAAEGYAATTIAVRHRVICAIAAAAGVDPVDLTRDHVITYLASRDVAPRTRRAYLSHLTAWGRRIERDLTGGIRRPRQQPGLPRPISEPQMARLMLASTPGTPERAWLILGAFAGCRSFESAKVAGGDLEQHDGGWSLRIVGKGGQLGIVPVPQAVVDELTPWIRACDGGRLWPTATAASVQDALRTLGKRAGVRFSSHQLRHRYGTVVYRSTGRSLLDTQKAMRHRSPTTTAGYALIDASTLRAAINDLPGLPGANRKEAR